MGVCVILTRHIPWTVWNSLFKFQQKKGKESKAEQTNKPQWLGMNDFNSQSLIRYHKRWCVCEGVWAHWNRDERVGGAKLVQLILKWAMGILENLGQLSFSSSLPFVQVFVAQSFKYLQISSTTLLCLMLRVYERWMKLWESVCFYSPCLLIVNTIFILNIYYVCDLYNVLYFCYK